MYNDPGKITRKLTEHFTNLRKQQDLTLDDLASRAGVHRTAIGLLERGERQPSVEMAFRLSSALGVSLSTLIAELEMEESSISSASFSQDLEIIMQVREARLQPSYFRNEDKLGEITGLTSAMLCQAIRNTYHTLDFIDTQLISRSSPPLANMVELANLSSMVGNIIGASIAEASSGLYIRNRPHAYPDLLPQRPPAVPLELKIALETNKPKGHLPKPGIFITLRYVLGNKAGVFSRGKENRGDTVWLWEVKVGNIAVTDYDISNTVGDSGKTAVIKSEKFNKEMALVYFVPEMLPYGSKIPTLYPGYN